MNNDEKTEKIKSWLGTGSINIFGIQFSGKDTVGKRLADVLDAEFISSGDVVRANAEQLNNAEAQDRGLLSPTTKYSELIREFLLSKKQTKKPLVLCSFGRWVGEEASVIEATNQSGHPIKAVIVLKISEQEVFSRWRKSFEIGDRPGRVDESEDGLRTRLAEFYAKTIPVIEAYRDMGLLVEINGEQSRDAVFVEVIDKLFKFIG